MLNIGECPNEENESFLSQILQDSPPEKYYLSQKACTGILRRAKERGKTLPPMLEQALKAQASRVQCLNDQGGSVMDVSDKAGTLRAQSHGHEPIVHMICGNIIGRENQNGGHQMGVGQDVSYTLNTVDRHAVAVGYRAGQYGQYVQDDKAGSTRASGGDLGGGERNPNQRKVGCLNARDYKGVGSQYVNEGKLVIDDSQ
jgi:DNA (cytosine-5)-methyltransferase 1